MWGTSATIIIGLVLVCLPSGSTDVTTSPSRYMTQPSGIPILSPVLFMHVGDPYIPLFKIRRIFDLLVQCTVEPLHTATPETGHLSDQDTFF